ncbi:glutathione peroxidase [Arcticibacter sp. MXS-1]|uniref:glutathione peroxidase n=1 Tax=Arcticibacter sp. MXS-1 TaxID=3341726 RepID=UPI0035A82990
MNLKQRILRTFYPHIMRLTKSDRSKGRILLNESLAVPAACFYDLSAVLNNGTARRFREFRGKKVLLVNTASNCGYTGQYQELQRLHEEYGDRLAIIGFPANDFRDQERGIDRDIAVFCELNYGVTFPLAAKSCVLKGEGQNDVYKWLSSPELNGWNSQEPDWNFSKYLINEQGILTHYFGPAISPLSEDLLKEIRD